MVIISGPKVHNFAFADFEGHLPLFRSPSDLVKVLLVDFAIYGREDPSTNFGAVGKRRQVGFQSCF